MAKPTQDQITKEIETLKAQAEVEPLRRLSSQLADLKRTGGQKSMAAYIRNAKLVLFSSSSRVIAEVKS